MKCLLILNPYSKNGLREQEIQYFIKEMSVKYATDIFEPSLGMTIKEFLSSKDVNYDLVVCAGGDGTLHIVLNALMKLEHPPVVGILPKGTMNDFAKSLGYTKSLSNSIRALLDGKTVDIYPYQINDVYSFYAFGIGRYSCVAYQANHKKILGRFAYYFCCLKDLFRYKPTLLLKDNKSIPVANLFLWTQRYMAGYKLDSTNQIAYIKAKNPFIDTIRLYLFLLSKGKRHAKHMMPDELEFSSTVDATIDGEQYASKRFLISRSKRNIRIIKCLKK